MSAEKISRRWGIAMLAVVSLAFTACGSSTSEKDASDKKQSNESIDEQVSLNDEAPPTPDGGQVTDPGDDASASPSTEGVPSVLVDTVKIDGESFDASVISGRPTVVWFWAPWCTVCRAEAPNVVEVMSRYDDRVTFIGVAGRGQAAEMRTFVADTETDGLEHLDDSSGAIWEEFGIFTQPSFAFITADGDYETVTGALGVDGLSDAIDEKLL